MGVQLRWDDDDKTVIYMEIEDPWTWDEVYPAKDEATRMANSVPGHTVHLILDMRQSKNAPPNALTHLKSLTSKRTTNTGITVFVLEHRFLISLYETATRIFDWIARDTKLVNTLDEAYALVAEAKLDPA